MDSRRAGAIALMVVAIACRLCAVALCALVVILCFSGLSAKLDLVGLVIDISRIVPDVIAGYGVITSPFGGVFRFDFTILAVILFAIDYACVRISRSLRTGGA